MYLKKMVALLLLSIAPGLFVMGRALRQPHVSAGKIKNAVYGHHALIFMVQYAEPAHGGNIFLTSAYELRLTPDTLITDLPYYGRAFVAPLDPADVGVRIATTHFSRRITEKKFCWDVLLLPARAEDINSLHLSVSKDGSATLMVVSDTRESISYRGYIVTQEK